jgi:hypothetical protein
VGLQIYQLVPCNNEVSIILNCTMVGSEMSMAIATLSRSRSFYSQ